VAIYAHGNGHSHLFAGRSVYAVDQSGPLDSKIGGVRIQRLPRYRQALYFYRPDQPPVVDAATPSRIVTPSDLQSLTYISRTTKWPDQVSILLTGKHMTGEVERQGRYYPLRIPNTLLQDRAVHQIAVVQPGGAFSCVETVNFEVSRSRSLHISAILFCGNALEKSGQASTQRSRI